MLSLVEFLAVIASHCTMEQDHVKLHKLPAAKKAFSLNGQKTSLSVVN